MRIFSGLVAAGVITATLVGIGTSPANAANLQMGSTVGWGAASAVTVSGYDNKVRVAGSADGSKVVAVWQSAVGVDTVIKAATATVSDGTSTWSATQDLTSGGEDASVPQLVVSADGASATAIWQRTSGSDVVVETRSASIASNIASWGATTALSSGVDATAPQLAANTDASLVSAIWVANDGATSLVSSASALVGGASATWSAPHNVTSAAMAATPKIDASDSGTSISAIWGHSDAGAFVFQSASGTVDPGTGTQTWGSATDLEASRDGDQLGTSPAIAVSADGSTAVAGYSRRHPGLGGSADEIRFASGAIAGSSAVWGTPTTSGTVTANIDLALQLNPAGTRAAALVAVSGGGAGDVHVIAGTVAATASTWGNRNTGAVGGGRSVGTPTLQISEDGQNFVGAFANSLPPNGIDQNVNVTSGRIGTGNVIATSRTVVLSEEGYSAALAASTDATNATVVWHESTLTGGMRAMSGDAPDVPTISSVAMTSANARVTVTAGGAKDLSGYYVFASSGASCTITAPASFCDLGIPNGTDVSFTAQAFNDVGQSLVSAPTASYTVNPVAGPPTVVGAQSGAGVVTATVTAGSPNTAKEYLVRVVGSPGDSCTVAPAATMCVINGLTPGSYTLEVVAKNDAGDSAVAQSGAFTVLAPPGAPSATVTAAGLGAVSATVSPGSPNTASSYTVQVVGAPAYSCTITPPESACTILGIPAGDYAFEAIAHNVAGDVTSSPTEPVSVVGPTPVGSSAKVQRPVGGCIPTGSGPKRIAKTGLTRLMKEKCRTNSGSRTRFAVTKAKFRADAATYRLVCKIGGATLVKPTKVKGARDVYCRRGALHIQTYGRPMSFRMRWSAPQVGEHAEYRMVRSYVTK